MKSNAVITECTCVKWWWGTVPICKKLILELKNFLQLSLLFPYKPYRTRIYTHLKRNKLKLKVAYVFGLINYSKVYFLLLTFQGVPLDFFEYEHRITYKQFKSLPFKNFKHSWSHVQMYLQTTESFPGIYFFICKILQSWFFRI